MEIKLKKVYDKEEDFYKDEKKRLKKKERIQEKIDEAECEGCGERLAVVGYSSTPGICKGCEDLLVAGKKLKTWEEEDE